MDKRGVLTKQYGTPTAQGGGTKNRVPAPQAISMAQARRAANDTIDLVEMFYRMLKEVWWIVAATVIGAALAAVYSFSFATPVYQSQASMYVVNPKDTVVDLSVLQVGSQITGDYQELFKTRTVTREVIAVLGLPYTVDELRGMLTLSTPANTRVLYITIR
jgi:capsular polysaccharide biosynthesis protein